MPTTAQIDFEMRDVAVALMKLQGVHDGRWHLVFNFSVAIGEMMGRDQSESRPGALFQVQKLALVRADDAPSDSPLVFDAAAENPRT